MVPIGVGVVYHHKYPQIATMGGPRCAGEACNKSMLSKNYCSDQLSLRAVVILAVSAVAVALLLVSLAPAVQCTTSWGC